MSCLLTHARSGLRLVARHGRGSPILNLLLPGQPEDARGIEVELPEHAWGRRCGEQHARRLHAGALGSGAAGAPPRWRPDSGGLVCELPLELGLALSVRVSLEDDGLRIAYDFDNPTPFDFDVIQAVTCVQLHDDFSDLRLERSWIHHADGFALLAGGVEERLTQEPSRWLPCRCMASFRWPVPAERREIVDGVTRHHAPRAVDEPFIATSSRDGAWIAATCTRETGNVWSNPERTCQHADPSAPLAAGARARLELKTFVTPAGLDEVLAVGGAARARR